MQGNIGVNEIEVFSILILKRYTLPCHLFLHKSNVVLLLCLIEYNEPISVFGTSHDAPPPSSHIFFDNFRKAE
jgi:hypothetical protein